MPASALHRTDESVRRRCDLAPRVHTQSQCFPDGHPGESAKALDAADPLSPGRDGEVDEVDARRVDELNGPEVGINPAVDRCRGLPWIVIRSSPWMETFSWQVPETRSAADGSRQASAGRR